MRTTKLLVSLIAIFSSLTILSAHSNTDIDLQEPSVEKQHRIGLGVGVWDLDDNADSVVAHFSYEFQELENLWGVRPSILVLTDFDSRHYFSGGWIKEFTINDSWSWGFGGQAGYFHNPEELGYDVEFYTRLLVNYHVTKKSFVRLEGGHISNAGLGDQNPGTENITLSYFWHW